MPAIRPTLADIKDQLLSSFDLNLQEPGLDARLRRSALEVWCTVLAGVTWMLYGYVDYQWRQAFIMTADEDNLEPNHGDPLKVPRKQAAKASGNVTATGAVGSIIPPNTLMQRSDGVQFKTTAEVILSTSSATVPVQAVASGEAGNTLTGSSLTLVTPVAGINSTVVTAGNLAGGADVESLAAYRIRLRDAKARPAHGGSIDDYDRWAKEVAGVTRVWVYPTAYGGASVLLRIMKDETYANGIPTTEDCDEVREYIEARSRKPATAEIFVVPPTPFPIDLTLTVSPNTQDVRDSIIAELKDMLYDYAVPGGLVRYSWLREAISRGAGEVYHTVSVPATQDDIAVPDGALAVLGTVTFL